MSGYHCRYSRHSYGLHPEILQVAESLHVSVQRLFLFHTAGIADTLQVADNLHASVRILFIFHIAGIADILRVANNPHVPCRNLRNVEIWSGTNRYGLLGPSFVGPERTESSCAFFQWGVFVDESAFANICT